MAWLDAAAIQRIVVITILVPLVIGAAPFVARRRSRRSAEPLTDGTTLIRPATADDATAFRSSIDHVVRHEMGWDDSDVESFVAVLTSGADHGIQAIVEVAAGDDRLIGVITTNIDTGMRQTTRLGWWVGPDHRRRGHLRRAVRLVTDRTLAADWSVVADCSPDNVGSRRVLEELDFIHTGTRELRLREGRWTIGWCFERHPSGDRPPVTAESSGSAH